MRDRAGPLADHAVDGPESAQERQGNARAPVYPAGDGRRGRDHAITDAAAGSLATRPGSASRSACTAVSFGVLAVAAGLSAAQACVMSMLVFTGASQFAFVGVLAGGGGALAAIGPAVMLAARNAAYGLSLAPILRGRLRAARARRAARDRRDHRDGPRAGRAGARRGARSSPPASRVWVCWNAGTLIGALLGGGLGDPRTLGLDAMFPAAFLALLGAAAAPPGRAGRRDRRRG